MPQEIDLEKYHQLALQKQKEHRKVLADLKKKPPKNLDKIAQEIHDEVFQEIDCTACAKGQILRKRISPASLSISK